MKSRHPYTALLVAALVAMVAGGCHSKEITDEMSDSTNRFISESAAADSFSAVWFASSEKVASSCQCRLFSTPQCDLAARAKSPTSSKESR